MKSDKMSCSHDEIDILFALTQFDYHSITNVVCINANKNKPNLSLPGKRAGLIYQFVYAIKRTRAEDDIC